jgi:hypothetical protein
LVSSAMRLAFAPKHSKCREFQPSAQRRYWMAHDAYLFSVALAVARHSQIDNSRTGDPWVASRLPASTRYVLRVNDIPLIRLSDKDPAPDSGAFDGCARRGLC